MNCCSDLDIKLKVFALRTKLDAIKASSGILDRALDQWKNTLKNYGDLEKTPFKVTLSELKLLTECGGGFNKQLHGMPVELKA